MQKTVWMDTARRAALFHINREAADTRAYPNNALNI